MVGLTKMGKTKMQLAEEAEADRNCDQQKNRIGHRAVAPEHGSSLLDRAYAEFLVGSAHAQESRSDEMSVMPAPGEGAEIKLVMVKGAQANYAWSVRGELGPTAMRRREYLLRKGPRRCRG